MLGGLEGGAGGGNDGVAPINKITTTTAAATPSRTIVPNRILHLYSFHVLTRKLSFASGVSGGSETSRTLSRGTGGAFIVTFISTL